MGRALFLGPCNVGRRARSNGYYEYAIFLSAQPAKIANAKVGIRATNVDVALGRLPAGFYTAVQHSGQEWRTKNQRVSLTDNVIEWAGPIPM